MVGGIGWNSLLTDEVLFLLERFFLGNTNHRPESKTRVLWTLVIFHAVNTFCPNVPIIVIYIMNETTSQRIAIENVTDLTSK